jgi:enoyl-CoA hydratase/carnithine racemase
MGLLQIEYDGEVAILKLNRGVTNAINLELVTELSDAVEEVRRSRDVRALVLTSSNDKFFSIGFDVPQLYNLNRRDFEKFYYSFSQLCLNLYTLPKPTIAAITGHAIAGGYILALCCDYRFIGEGRKLIGLNEIKLGLPLPLLAYCILRQLVGDRNASEIVYTGEFYTPIDALEMRMVDQVLPPTEVLSKSIEKVRELAKLPDKAFEAIKRNHVKTIEKEFLENFEDDMNTFVDFWFSDEAQKLLKEAIKNF